jgi:hypothetical protein
LKKDQIYSTIATVHKNKVSKSTALMTPCTPQLAANPTSLPCPIMLCCDQAGDLASLSKSMQI